MRKMLPYVGGKGLVQEGNAIIPKEANPVMIASRLVIIVDFIFILMSFDH